MKNLNAFLAVAGMAISLVGNAQDMPAQSLNPKLIAVLNRANWCNVCRANGQRFGAVLMPYAAKGVNIYINDLTNSTTKATSEAELQKANVYEAVTTVPRKGMGKVLKACGLLHDKKQLSDVSGIVTLIDPKTHRQLTQFSIARSDGEVKNTIDNLLKKSL